MVQAVNILREKGAREILVAGYHAILSGPAIDRLRDANVHEIVVTDTVPLAPEKRIDKIETCSVTRLFADAIQAIHSGSSISTLFR